MQPSIRRSLLLLAAGTALTWSLAQAQAPATAGTAMVPQLTLRAFESDHGRYEVRAGDAQGARVTPYVNAAGGTMEATRLHR